MNIFTFIYFKENILIAKPLRFQSVVVNSDKMKLDSYTSADLVTFWLLRWCKGQKMKKLFNTIGNNVGFGGCDQALAGQKKIMLLLNIPSQII